MSVLFNRQFELNLGGTLISSSVPSADVHRTLRMSFNIKKDLSDELNTATIKVWNLSAETRKKLSEPKLLSTRLKLGYGKVLFDVFAGDLFFSSSVHDGPDWISTMEFKDGWFKQIGSRISYTNSAGTDIGQVLTDVGIATGLDLGNLQTHLVNQRSTLKKLIRGIALEGSAIAVFRDLAKQTGQNFSIQDGRIQMLVTKLVEALPDKQTKLTYKSGLLGSPEVSENGIVRARSLIQPGLFPGNSVFIDSVSGARPVKGSFLILSSVFTGDVYGHDWQVEMDCYPLPSNRPATAGGPPVTEAVA